MRVLIWIKDESKLDALAVLASVGFQQDMDWGEDEGLPGLTLIVGYMPDDKANELDLISGIDGWYADEPVGEPVTTSSSKTK